MTDDRKQQHNRVVTDDEDEDGGLPWLQPADVDGGSGGISTRTMIIGAAAFVVLFAAALWIVYDQVAGDRGRTTVASSEEPPLIEAPAEPHRVPPDDPGGAEIPNQDKLVLDAGSATAVEPDARLSSGAETPLERESGSFTAATETLAEAASQAASEPAPAKISTPAPVVAAPQGNFLLQLGAFSTDDRARAGWTTLLNKFAPVIGDLSMSIEVATSGGKTLYKLRAAAVATRAEADRRCAELKTQGQGCFVVQQ